MKQQKSKKVRAILAGGLVLGVGAAVTLAAWSDSEFAKETFTAGKFNLQGSTVEAGPYTDHATADGAADLVFSDVFSNLAPGDTAYAPYWLRLDSNSTVNGSLTPSGVSVFESGGTNADAISYRITEVADGETCGKDEALDTAPVATGTDLNADPADATEITLVANPAGTDGTAVQLCIAVTAAADTFEQGVLTTATWQFDAESKTAS